MQSTDTSRDDMPMHALVMSSTDGVGTIISTSNQVSHISIICFCLDESTIHLGLMNHLYVYFPVI